ncbi:MAG: LemA family protein [Thermodesulfobacteriota bacterium]
MSVKLIAGVAGVVLFLLILIYLYNKLVRLRIAVKNAWSDINVHLKKRYELLPNLIEAVKGYASHESETLARVIELRSRAMKAEAPSEKARADNQLTQTLKSLFALVEAYPSLKADAHFTQIMADMKGIDDNIEHARRFYNASVREYNVACAVFPLNVVASAFSFLPEQFFELSDEQEEAKPVRADFRGHHT